MSLSRKEYQRQYYLKNRDKHNAAMKAWRDNNKEQAAKLRIKSRAKTKYGLTLEEYQAILDKPCGICGSPSTCVDHCHETNKVRGGLCDKCNKGLGFFLDSITLLQNAIGYLQ